MPKISVSQQFDCPPERAFAAVTDFPYLANYIGGIERIDMLTDGPVGLGTRVRETRTMYGREASEEMEITGWEPPHRAVIEAHSHGAHYTSTYTFTPKNGGTNVRLVFDARPQSLGAHLMAFLMRRAVKSVRVMFENDLSDARRHAELDAS